MAMVASRRLPSVAAGPVLLASTAACWWLATPAHADDATVIVESAEDGGRYAPNEITIELGDTVTWVWETNGHSVTHEPEDGQEPVFDSHPNDGQDPILCPPFCGMEGETYAVSDFPEPGRYAPSAGAPAVARDDTSLSPVPSPTFEDFPSASEPNDDADGEGGTARTVWAVVGGASVLGTLGAFGRTVLFSDAWDG